LKEKLDGTQFFSLT
jgi:hypothetical protein